MKKYNRYRHGDLSFHPTKKVSGEIVKHSGSFVLALGEATGHKHVISVPNLEDMQIRKLPDGGYILTLKAAGTLSHEEHGNVVLPPGRYMQKNEREYDWFGLAVRRVVD